MATPFDYEAIRNTIAHYCIALDNKDFSLFDDIFVEDLKAKYPFGDPFSSRSVLAAAIQKRLGPVVTQHALTTQTIVVDAEGRKASATTYFTGVHLGQGRWKGQLVTAYGKYIDELICLPQGKALSGASGQWLINQREVVFMGRVGEEGVMKGEED